LTKQLKNPSIHSSLEQLRALGLLQRTWPIWYFLAKTIFRVQSFVNCPNPCMLLSFLHQEASIASKNLNNFKPSQVLYSRCFVNIISSEYRCNFLCSKKTRGHGSLFHNISSHVSHVIVHFYIILYIHFHSLFFSISKPCHILLLYRCIVP